MHVAEIMQTVKMEKNEWFHNAESPYGSGKAIRKMMKYGYKLGFGLGARLNGIIEPIQQKKQKDTTDLGYQSAIGKVLNSNPETKVFVPDHVPSQGQGSTPEEEIVDGIEKLFVAIYEECCSKADIKAPTIRDAEPGEIL